MRQDYPQDPGVLNNWAVVAAHDGQWDDAVAVWADALAIQPNHLHALIGRAHYALHQKAWREAYQWGLCALNTHPDSPDAHRIIVAALGRLGNTHIQASEWDPAAAVAHQLLQYQPDSPTAFYLLGRVELGQDKPAVKAEQHFRKSLALIDSAPINSDKTSLDQVLWALGDSLYRQQRFTEALKIFRKLKETHPDDEAVQNGERNTLTQLVKQAVAQGAGNPIKTWSDELITINPSSMVGWNARGLYFIDHARQPREAIPCFQRALEHATDPKDKATCATNLGWAWMSRHRVGHADRSFREAAQWNPHGKDVRTALRVRRMQKQYDSLLAVAFVVVVIVMAFH